MLQAALEGLKVIDLTHYVAGPNCTKLLADYGAEVIKVERPGVGDRSRHLGAFPDDIPDPERSALFLHLNADKKGITLNLKDPKGVAILKELVRGADILVENFHPRVMPSLGLSYDTLDAVNPQLIMVSISDFGQTGPYRDYKGSEIVDYALGGAFYTTGPADRPPLKLGGNVVAYYAGVHAAVATVTAVLGQMRRGSGDHLDISIQQTQAGSPDRLGPMLMGHQFNNKEVWHRGVSRPPVRPCLDGYMNIQIGGPKGPERVGPMLGRPDLGTDPRFADPIEAVKPENQEAFEEIFLMWILDKTMSEAWEAAQKAQVASGPIYTAKDILADPHFRSRGFWEEIDHAIAGRFEYSGLPFRIPGEEQVPRIAPPQLGEHTEEVLAEIGYDTAAVAALREEGVV